MDLNNAPGIYGVFTTIAILIIIAWTLPWKGVALWKSARNDQLAWFIVLLLVNTLGILEILYIFFFQKQKEGSVS